MVPPDPQQQQTPDKAGDIERDVDEMARRIRYSRFVRLDAHAKKMLWVLTQPPAEAAKDKVALGWWQEWVKLKMEFDPPPPPPSKAPEPKR